MSIWDSVERGARFGERLLQNRDRREYGEAFQSGGIGQVAQAAGARGDLETYEGAQMAQRRERQFDDDQTNQSFERFKQFGPMASAILRRAQQLPPEQRGQFLNAPHIRQRFEAFGFQPEQIDTAIGHLGNPETAEQTFANLFAAFGGQGLDWSVVNPQTGEIGAIDEGGQYVASGDQAPTGFGQEWRPATPEEAGGFRPGSAVDINVRTGERRLRQGPGASGQAQGSYPDDGYDYE